MPGSKMDYAGGESWKSGSEGKRERMAVYLDWLLAPKGERTPSTKKGLAEVLGVSTATLRNYTQDPWLQKNLSTRVRATARVELLPDVLASLYDQAVDRLNPRSVAAAGKYLDYLRQAEELGDDGINLEDMSEDDLNKVIAALMNKAASGG